MTTQDVDPKTYYAVGNGLYEKAGKLYEAFSVNVKILGETGSMAGTDDAGTAWAASYDTRVGEVLGAVNDLTAAMQNYGGVIIQAGYNHAVAEHAATPGQQGPAPVKPTEPPSVAGCLAAPPSAGGPGRGLLDDAIGLVEQLGVPVPDGDTDKIAKAADAWNRLATVYQTKSIVEALDVDARAFADTRSPEVGQIVDDLHALRDAASSVLGGCAELAKSCRAYESALDDLRNQLEGILRDLAIELAVTAAITIAASFVSFGAGAIAGTAKAAQSIKKFAGIITEAIGSWKITRSISKGVDSIEDIVGVRSKLQRLKSLGRKGKPEERPLPPPPTRPGVPPGWVARPADSGLGTVYQQPGAAGSSNSVRIMEPGADPRYPNGYVKFTNEHNQPVNLDGKPGTRADSHIPRNANGSYPIPKGWP